MCGIFAVSGQDLAGPLILEGLKKLEYRGYDSWGIAIRQDSQIITAKDVGKISQVSQDFVSGTEAIGHSRWATHGGVTKANSHPHTQGNVTVVHNGIFENFEAHKEQLQSTGTIFLSETDTEVIAALINEALKTGISVPEAISNVSQKIEGRFALVAMVSGHDGIYAVRRGSPLIIGRSDTNNFIASDIPAFLEKTQTVNYLDDDEMVFIHDSTVQFYNVKTLKPIEKRNIEVQWQVEEAEKGDFPHFMIKEIFEQKETIARAINHEDSLLKEAVDLLHQSNGVYFVSCGTAHKVSATAEYFFTQISGRKINVVPASEMPFFEKFINEKTAIIAVSQSGETADVLEVLESGKKKNAKILALTNVKSSSMARMANVHLPINAGIEKAVASTKAATAQMALLFLLAYADINKTNIGRDVLRSTISAINDLLNPRYEEHVRSVAKEIVDWDKLFIIGRGPLFPMALESAIKIQEVSYIHAQGFAAGELKHGPIALIEKGIPCIVLGDDLETLSNAVELKSRGALIVGVSAKNAAVFDFWIRVPDCDGAQAIASIIPIQILSYHLAVLRGLDPDMPRNLAKSVTVK